MFGKRGGACVTVGRVDHDGITGHQIVVTRREEEEKGFSIAAENKQVGPCSPAQNQTALPCWTPYSRKQQ